MPTYTIFSHKKMLKRTFAKDFMKSAKKLKGKNEVYLIENGESILSCYFSKDKKAEVYDFKILEKNKQKITTKISFDTTNKIISWNGHNYSFKDFLRAFAHLLYMSFGETFSKNLSKFEEMASYDCTCLTGIYYNVNQY